MSRWRSALRIARRSALRAPGRTILVVALIALPVFTAVLIDLIVRTGAPPLETYARWRMGSADALVQATHRDRIPPELVPVSYSSVEYGKPQRDPRAVDVAGLLPAGTRSMAAPMRGGAELLAGSRSVHVEVRALDGANPLAEGMVEVRSGQYPGRPDRLAVSTPVAERLDLQIGDPVRVGETTATVSGIVDDPARLDGFVAWITPGSSLRPATMESIGLGEEPGHAGFSPGPAALVDLPDGSPDRLGALVTSLAGEGVLLYPKDAILHPDDWMPDTAAGWFDPDDLAALAFGALVIGFGLLEIVLLAGAAFAVGARRQVRELGLVAATGGSARDVRGIVLAQGIVLGGLGAVAGLLAGIGLPMLLRPLAEQHVLGQRIDTWGLAWADYAAFAAVGLFSGLIAAVLPAVRAGRMPVIAALSRRIATSRGPAGFPKLAVLLMGLGVASSVAGATLIAGSFDGFRREAEELALDGSASVSADLTAAVWLSILGFVLLAIGLLRMMPALVSWVATLGRLFPAGLRMACRDASRQRHRVAPVASAIMVAVAGSVFAAFQVAADDARSKASYTPETPPGWVRVSARGDAEAEPDGLRAIARELDASATHVMGRPAVEHQPVRECYGIALDQACGVVAFNGEGSWVDVRVVDTAYVRSLPAREPETTGALPDRGSDLEPAQAAAEALDAGRVVVVDPAYAGEDGRVHLIAHNREQEVEPYLFRTAEPYAQARVLMSRETAGVLGYGVEPAGWILETEGVPEQAALDRANALAQTIGLDLSVERGYQSSYGLLLVVATGAAAFVTLAGVAISVALSTAESRADFATLAAIGAAPRRRRWIAAAQALVVGGIGCLLGVGLGGFLSFLAQAFASSPVFAVPWQSLLGTAIGVPLLAALCAAVMTRSELPLIRRIE